MYVCSFANASACLRSKGPPQFEIVLHAPSTRNYAPHEPDSVYEVHTKVARVRTSNAFIIEFSIKNNAACTTSSGSAALLGKIAAAFNSSIMYGNLSPIIFEATTEGETETTRIPEGPR